MTLALALTMTLTMTMTMTMTITIHTSHVIRLTSQKSELTSNASTLEFFPSMYEITTGEVLW